jgi:hypothetical protein
MDGERGSGRGERNAVTNLGEEVPSEEGEVAGFPGAGVDLRVSLEEGVGGEGELLLGVDAEAVLAGSGVGAAQPQGGLHHHPIPLQYYQTHRGGGGGGGGVEIDRVRPVLCTDELGLVWEPSGEDDDEDFDALGRACFYSSSSPFHHFGLG